MIIVWTGLGFWTVGILVGIPGLLAAVTTLAAGEDAFDAHPAVLGVGLILAALTNWYVGCRLNRRPFTEFGKPKGGGRWRRGPHRVFMLPMEYCSAPILLWGVYLIVSEAVGLG
jgi:hypothetical protein